MCQILGETLKDFKNIKIIQEDILKIKNSNLFKNLKIKNYKIISNIPYYLTSPLIRKFLENPHPPSDMILMLQKEVAQRICALRQAQGKPNMNLLAVSVQFYAEPKIISYVSKNCFWPSPKVDSAIIKIIPKALEGQTFQCPPKNFFKIVKAGFSHPRKQLVNNLTGSKLLNGVKLDKVKISKWLLENNIKPEQRPETLSVLNWENLTKSYAKFIQC
jgi:16S rRNA (adenine1518-N6/adenine1519-N6)-dimethyltransferase